MTTTNTCGVTAVAVGCGGSVGTASVDAAADDVGLEGTSAVDRCALLPPQAATAAAKIAQAANAARVREIRITSR
jgi:hypothetical protein